MSNVLENNLKLLKKRMPNLFEAIQKCPKSDCEYIVSDAKSGAKTLAVKKDGKTYQVHSKYDPIKEAEQLVENAKLVNPKVLMVMGFGLGYHLRAALKKHNAENLFTIVIERDVIAFKTAIENVDITDLIENPKCIWVVGIRPEESFVILQEVLKKVGITIQLFLKTLQVLDHPVLTKIHGNYHQHTLKCFRDAAFNILFNYGNSSEDSMIGLQSIFDNLSLILKSPGVQDLYGKFKGVPGILVSTGPSLDQNIEDLKLAEGKCVMVAADASLKPLWKHNIVPHIAVAVERVPLTAKMFREVPDDYKAKIWMGGCPVILKESYDAWCGPKFMTYRNFAHFDWIQIPRGTLTTGPSCSNLGYKVLEAMGCDPIILVGQDCAFKSFEKTHAANASEVVKLTKLKKTDLYPVKGNYEEFVYTSRIYDMFRKAFETDMLTKPCKVINATEGGAYIHGTEIATLKETIEKYCTKPVDTYGILKKNCYYPTKEEQMTQWLKTRKIMVETRDEVQGVLDSCNDGRDKIAKFEERLERDNFKEIPDFLERFPDKEIEDFVVMLNQKKAKIITGSKYFNLYLMHIVQMIIVKFELDLNQLPSLCDDKKRCNLQRVKLMKKWFYEVGGICQLAQNMLIKALGQLDEEFGTADK